MRTDRRSEIREIESSARNGSVLTLRDQVEENGCANCFPNVHAKDRQVVILCSGA